VEPDGLLEYDGLLFGIPTRYGNFPVQWKAFWDKTGPIWAKGGYWGKFAGLFISTGTPGGGQESTAMAAMSTLSHHGIIYVPLGYKTVFPLLTDMSELHGGSPWGAGTYVSHLLPVVFKVLGKGSNSRKAGGDGSRQPTALELSIAVAQGSAFFKHISGI